MPDKALPVSCLSGIRVHATRQARHPPRTPPHEGDGPDKYPRPCHGDGEPACSARAACTEEAVQAYGPGQACGHGHAAALQAHGDLSLWPMCAQLCPSYAARVSRRQWMSAVSRLKVFALVIVLGAATGWTSSCGIGAAGSPVCTPAAGKPPGEGGPRLATSDGFAAHAEPALAVDPHQ